MKKILIRTATGSIYVALLVAAMTCGQYIFLAVFGIILTLAVYELQTLCDKSTSVLLSVIDILAAPAIFASAFFYFPEKETLSPMYATAGYLILRSVLQLYLKKGDPIRQLSASYMGVLIAVFPFVLLADIFFASNGNTTLLACLIFIWVNDTGAFCVGSLIGKRRLFERISPKKSWEGFFGGLFFTVISALIISTYFSDYFSGMTVYQWTGLSLVVSVFSTWGDLVESMIKRASGTKDSGHILPGHGGILDRIDSLLLVVPAVYIYLAIIN